MIRTIAISALMALCVPMTYCSIDGELPPLREQRQEKVVVRTTQGLQIFIEESTPYTGKTFGEYINEGKISERYAPHLSKKHVDKTLVRLETLLGEKSFTPSRSGLYSQYLGPWSELSTFKECVNVLSTYEDFLFPECAAPAHIPGSLFPHTYLLDASAQAGEPLVYDRSILLPAYFSLPPHELLHRISLLLPYRTNLFENAYGPRYSRIRAHMIHGLLKMDPETMPSRLDYALKSLKQESSADPYVNMTMLVTYASRDPKVQASNLAFAEENLSHLILNRTLDMNLYLLRKGVFSTLSHGKAEAFANENAKIFFTDCATESISEIQAVRKNHCLDINGFLIMMDPEKVDILGSTFSGIAQKHKVSAHDLRLLGLNLSTLPLECLQSLSACYEDLFTPEMSVHELRRFHIFKDFSHEQICVSALLMKMSSHHNEASHEKWEEIPKLVFNMLTQDHVRLLMSDKAKVFMDNLGHMGRREFIMNSLKNLESTHLHALLHHGLPLFPELLNDDAEYLCEVTRQINLLTSEEIPHLVMHLTKENAPLSSSCIATAVEALVSMRHGSSMKDLSTSKS